MSRLLDGKKAARALRAEVARAVAEMTAAGLPAPCLAVVLVGDDPASEIYVRSKVRACREAGLAAVEERLPASTTQAELLQVVKRLVRDDGVDGILVQMPLPEGIDRRAIIRALDPEKDVDGFHPVNVGRLWTGEDGFVPCTPLGIIELLDREGIAIEGAEAVVLGRSEIVGKPMAALLLRRHATVTLCHSRTRDLPRVAARADILVAAIGKRAFVTREFIKPGATVIDVGINQVRDAAQGRDLFGEDPARLEQLSTKGYTLVGDVHPRDVAERAGAHTPVPGGVGPLTVALLLKNTLQAARARRSPGGSGRDGR
ncbi:MAG: bifunctional 5,10-methylenetetrahydrofolate dehydrogenase/5,10-methenyltetrahydrofolate cyclohydrolase [Acidobacteriota bacterium]